MVYMVIVYYFRFYLLLALRDMRKRLCLSGFSSNSTFHSLSSFQIFALPRSYGPITIHSLGTICPLPVFYSSHFIYPVGYSSSYRISSDLSIRCMIEKSDTNKPIFSIYINEKVFQSPTPSQVWKLVIDEITVMLNNSSSSTSTSTLPLPHNGLDVFGLSIPEVASAIASLPEARDCVGYQSPFPLNESIQTPIDWPSVLSSQWHPACTDFAMTEREHSFEDPTVYSPIFFGMSDHPTVSCSVCHMPPSSSCPLRHFDICDVDKSLEDLLTDGKWNGVKTISLWAHHSCGVFIIKRLSKLIKQLQTHLVE